MKYIFLIPLFALMIFGVVPAFAQTTTDHVVINEVDINPPGDDSASISEWVELYNPTDSEIDLSGWDIASTTVLKKTMTISNGTTIQSGEFLAYSYQTNWFTDSQESVELRDENGIVIDKTPIISDHANDFTSWQRIYDGYDSDSSADWKFVTSTAVSSNGKFVDSGQDKRISVNINGTLHDLNYNGTVTINTVTVDLKFISLVFSFDVLTDGILIVELERKTFDSRFNGADDDFIILLDGDQPNSSEIGTTATTRTLKIELPVGSEQLEIIGSSFNNPIAVILEEPQPEYNLTDKAITKFESQIKSWNDKIDKLTVRADNFESQGNLDTVGNIRAKIIVFESLVVYLESLIR